MSWPCDVKSENEPVQQISDVFRTRHQLKPVYQEKWSWNFIIILLQTHAQSLLTLKHRRPCFEENNKHADVMSKPGNRLNENAFFIHLIEGHNIGSDRIFPYKSVVPGSFQVKPASEMISCAGWVIGPIGGWCFSPAWSRFLYLKSERHRWRVGCAVSHPTAVLPLVRR